MPRILGVDYGDVRTGLALSDPSGFLASGIGYFTSTGLRNAARQIADKAQEHGAAKIVLGLPVNMNGTEGDRAQKVRALAEIINSMTDAEIIFMDERKSTVLAHTYLNSTDIKRGKKKSVIDTLSAQIILQNYLDGVRNTQQ